MNTADRITSLALVVCLALVITALLVMRSAPTPAPAPPEPVNWHEIPVYTGPVSNV